MANTNFPPGGTGTDPNAIHVNLPAEISGIPVKASPTTADVLVGEDAANGFAKIQIPIGNLPVIPGAAARLVVPAIKSSPGPAINPGDVVYIVGFDSGSGAITVELADASGAGTMPAYGIANATITDSVAGDLVVSGAVSGFDTSAFAVGAELFVSDATPGGLVAVRPDGAALVQQIGTVAISDLTSGAVQVTGAGRVNALPNLPEDFVWVGDANGVPVPVDKATIGAPLSDATPQTVGTAAPGTDTESSRSDHVHAHGNQGGASQHAAVVPAGASGFMTGAQATQLAATDPAGTARPPTAHRSSHEDGGTDLIRPSKLNAEGVGEEFRLVTNAAGTFDYVEDVGNAAQFGRYRFDGSSQAATQPPSGEYRRDNVTPGSTANIYVNSINNEGVDLDVVFGLFSVGDILYFQSLNTTGEWELYQITGAPVDNTGWWTFPVTPLQDSGTPIPNNRLAAFIWVSPGGGGGGASLAELKWKQPVRVATTAPGTLASDFENGDTVDGVVLATNDRILIKNQAAGVENGIYTVEASGAPSRATDLLASNVAASLAVIVSEGTANADTLWQCTNNDGSDTVGTDALVFQEVSGGGGSGDVTGPAGGTADGDNAVFADATGKVIRAVKNNQAASDPDENDDNTQGYEISSRWINTSTDEEFVCVDASTGAAVWTATTRVVISGIGGYIFDAATAAADPGAGQVRFDNATPADVTQIYVSDETQAGFDATDTLAKLAIGDQLFFRNAFDSLTSALFRVIAITVDNGAWFTVDVEPEATNSAFNDGTLLSTNVQKVAQFPPSSFGEWDFTISADAFLSPGDFGPGGNGSFGSDPSGWVSVSFHVDRQDGADLNDYLVSLGSGAHIAIYDSTQNDPIPIMLRCVGTASSPVASVIAVPVSYYSVTGAPQLLTAGRTYRMVAWPAPVQAARSFQTSHSATFTVLANSGTGANLRTFTVADGPNGVDLGKVLATFTTPYTIIDRGYRVDGVSLLSSVAVNFTAVNAAVWFLQPVRIRKTLGGAGITVTPIGAGSFLAAGAGTWEEISIDTSADAAAALIAGDEIGLQIGPLSGALPNDFRCIFEANTLKV